ncbi:Pre-mRNA-processing factor 19 [Phytophthora megakarya]|uniref:Pre-mRNA-processing factor 19 n=1 Tax=Phytophthora megakarya TaxID=4795 RepID=A0A225WXU0_9STRA|nr:Pre-mRNA-processing factor 19 [Phytophthora megakarya]
MLCSLSGQVPTQPVVSLKSGHVFEKRLLLKYLAQNQQRCPVTGEELDGDKDLLELKTTPSTKSATPASGAVLAPEAASIPQLLGTFQSEWDAVMLETFTLKQHLEQTRQELSHALYQHDAACRVIARLNAENATFKERVTKLASGAEEDVEMATQDGATLAPEVLANVEAKQKELAKQRKDFKKKDGPERAALLSGLDGWNMVSSHTLHDSDKPGVTCVAIDSKCPTLVATGGVDKHAKIFDTEKQQLVATLTGHVKKLNHVEFHPTADMVLTASHDKTVKLWTPQEEGYGVGYTLDGFDDAVTSASIHPTGNYVLSGSLDATWAIHDVRRGQLLSRHTLNGELSMPDPAAGKPKKTANEARCARFHPDGAIFGTAAKSKLVQMWALQSLSNVVTFEGHTAPVTALGFSENGYHLASGSEDGVVKLWDLRKATSFFELDLKKNQPKLKLGAIHSINFDGSGSHLAVASAQTVQVLKEVSKNHWEVVKTLGDHKAAVTGVQFAPDSSFLASTSMDRALKIYR